MSRGVQLLGRGGHTFCTSNPSLADEGPRGCVGALGVLGGALSARWEAQDNWNRARDNAIQSGNHMGLPNGTHEFNGLRVKVTDNNIIYKNRETGECHGIVKETGHRYTYSGW